ncbi:hypothetical protein WDU94_005591, partial [Cyamophila willieti]
MNAGKSGNVISKRTKNKISKIRKKYKVHTQYDPPNNEIEATIDTMKQKLSIYAQRLRNYKKSKERREHNLQFGRNQKIFYKQIKAERPQQMPENTEIPPDAEAIEQFWAGIWANEEHYNRTASWIKTIEDEATTIEEMPETRIDRPTFQTVIVKLKNWKCP